LHFQKIEKSARESVFLCETAAFTDVHLDLQIEDALRNVDKLHMARKDDVDFVKQVCAEHSLSVGHLMPKIEERKRVASVPRISKVRIDSTAASPRTKTSGRQLSQRVEGEMNRLGSNSSSETRATAPIALPSVSNVTIKREILHSETKHSIEWNAHSTSNNIPDSPLSELIRFSKQVQYRATNTTTRRGPNPSELKMTLRLRKQNRRSWMALPSLHRVRMISLMTFKPDQLKTTISHSHSRKKWAKVSKTHKTTHISTTNCGGTARRGL
jgi:hypothetical protein